MKDFLKEMNCKTSNKEYNMEEDIHELSCFVEHPIFDLSTGVDTIKEHNFLNKKHI